MHFCVDEWFNHSWRAPISWPRVPSIWDGGVFERVHRNAPCGELGVEEKTEENYAKGIEELDTELEPGTDANIYLGTDDTLYELDVHKHRNNDCYYHIGFAYEIASILNKKVTLPEDSHKEIEDDKDEENHTHIHPTCALCAISSSCL